MNPIKKKEKILNHYKQSVEFVEKLKVLTDSIWFQPISENKWSTCEIIGHLIYWDRFMIEKRLPYLTLENQQLEIPNVQEMNRQAAIESKRKMKDIVVKEFVDERYKLIALLSKLSQEEFSQSIVIGKSHLIMSEYFEGLIEHDLHHFQQIKDFLITFEEQKRVFRRE